MGEKNAICDVRSHHILLQHFDRCLRLRVQLGEHFFIAIRGCLVAKCRLAVFTLHLTENFEVFGIQVILVQLRVSHTFHLGRLFGLRRGFDCNEPLLDHVLVMARIRVAVERRLDPVIDVRVLHLRRLVHGLHHQLANLIHGRHLKHGRLAARLVVNPVCLVLVGLDCNLWLISTGDELIDHRLGLHESGDHFRLFGANDDGRGHSAKVFLWLVNVLVYQLHSCVDTGIDLIHFEASFSDLVTLLSHAHLAHRSGRDSIATHLGPNCPRFS